MQQKTAYLYATDVVAVWAPLRFAGVLISIGAHSRIDAEH